MCLTLPARIESIDASAPPAPTAVVEYGGLRRSVSLLYLPEAQVGDYVLVQAGFATGRIAEAEARAALALAAEMIRPAEGPVERVRPAPGAPA
jgi:hydrogenase expression/formation protein HypC